MGADPFRKITPESVAFFEAVRAGDAARVRELVGAEPRLLDARQPPEFLTGLGLAIRTGDVGVIAALLPTAFRSGRPPTGDYLIAAVMTGRLDLILALLRAGVDPNALGDDAQEEVWSPLTLA